MEIIVTIIEKLGYIGIGGLIAVENIFPPIPSEIILTFSGYATHHTTMTILGVTLAATIGSLVGALLLYIIGSCLTQNTLKKIIGSKVGKLLGFKMKDIQKADKLFQKHGKATVFFCRFIPIIRSLISIPAGMTMMRLLPFLSFTFLGSFVWNLVLVYLGAKSGEAWNYIASYVGKYSEIVGVILLVILVLIIIKKRKINKNHVQNEIS